MTGWGSEASLQGEIDRYKWNAPRSFAPHRIFFSISSHLIYDKNAQCTSNQTYSPPSWLFSDIDRPTPTTLSIKVFFSQGRQLMRTAGIPARCAGSPAPPLPPPPVTSSVTSITTTLPLHTPLLIHIRTPPTWFLFVLSYFFSFFFLFLFTYNKYNTGLAKNCIYYKS